jgi:hypothetical protein
VRGLVPKLVRNSGDQSMPGLHGMRAGIQEEEASGSVSILCLSGLKAGLSYKGCLLVAQITSNRHIEYAGYPGAAVNFAA